MGCYQAKWGKRTNFHEIMEIVYETNNCGMIWCIRNKGREVHTMRIANAFHGGNER